MNIVNKALIMILSLLVIINSVYAIGIGVSPGRVDFKNILKDGYAERTVTISTNSDQEIISHFEVKGDMGEWIRFEPNSTSFPVSKSTPYKLKIIAQPPKDLRNDTYSGTITIITDKYGDISGRAGGLVRAAVNLIVGMQITNLEVSECRAGAFELNDVEINYPLELSMVISNSGNVRVKPTVSIDIWDQNQNNLLVTRKMLLDEILPTTEKRITRAVDSSLGIGQYWASVAVDLCGAGDLLTFNVVEKGGIFDKGILKQINNQGWVLVGETVPIIASFQNAGGRAVYAKFKGDIKLDDKVIQPIETDEIEVPMGETTDFSTYFIPKESGRYVITGRVVYNKKLTFEKSSILNVNPSETQEKKNLFGVIPLIIYLIIAVTILFIVRKIVKEKRNNKRHQ